MDNTSGWGGIRVANADNKLGSPKKKEPTTRIRVPQSKAAHVQLYVEHLENGGFPFDELLGLLEEAKLLMRLGTASSPVEEVSATYELQKFSVQEYVQMKRKHQGEP